MQAELPPSPSGSVVLSTAPNDSERIVFVVDLHPEVGYVINSETGQLLLDSVKHSIMLCAHAKIKINPTHRFGLAVLTSAAHWATRGFTSNLEDFESAVSTLKPMREACTTFEFGSLLSLLEGVSASPAKTPESPYARPRAVLLYARSSVVPLWELNSAGSARLDLLYLHQAASSSNRPQAVYDALVQLVDAASDRAQHSAYVAELTTTGVRKLPTSLIACLAHAAQRVPQGQAHPLVDVDLLLGLVPPSPPAQGRRVSEARSARSEAESERNGLPRISPESSDDASSTAPTAPLTSALRRGLAQVKKLPRMGRRTSETNTSPGSGQDDSRRTSRSRG